MNKNICVSEETRITSRQLVDKTVVVSVLRLYLVEPGESSIH